MIIPIGNDTQRKNSCRGSLSMRSMVAIGVMAFSLANVSQADAEGPAVDDGRSDYRYARSGNLPSVSCRGFEPKYVRDHQTDGDLKIRSGDLVSIFLKNAYFAGVEGFFSSTAEAAILLNVDTNAPFVKKNPGDYGRLVYYSESITERAPVNASFVVATESTTDAKYFSIDAAVVQFDSKNSIVAKNLLKTLVSIGTSAVSPAVAPILSSLGNAVGTIQSGGTRTTQYRMGFILDSVEPKVRQPVMREGDIVLITSRLPDSSYTWDKLYYDHRNGALYTAEAPSKNDDNANCKKLVTNLDYLVLTVRKNIGVGLDASRSQTLADVIESARSRTTRTQDAVNLVTDQIKDSLSHDAARRAVSSYNSAVNKETRRLYLKEVALTLACGGNGNVGKKCGEVKVGDRRLVEDIRRRVLNDGVMCATDLETLIKEQGAGPAGPDYDQIITPIVDAILVRKPGQECGI